MHAEGTCDIFYEDDGESEKRVAPRFVKVLLSDEEKARANDARAAGQEIRLKPQAGKAGIERGQRVRAKYLGDIGGVNWFDGVVTAARRDGTFDLNYDDGGAARRNTGGASPPGSRHLA